MRVSTRTRYGFRALADLAPGYPDKPISLKEIADRQGVSLKYLEQVISALRTAGIVTAMRGVNGGYVLSRPPDQTNLKAAFLALEGTPVLINCLHDPAECVLREKCPTYPTWMKIHDAIMEVLENTTVVDLYRQGKQQDIIDYVI